MWPWPVIKGGIILPLGFRRVSAGHGAAAAEVMQRLQHVCLHTSLAFGGGKQAKCCVLCVVGAAARRRRPQAVREAFTFPLSKSSGPFFGCTT